MFGLKNLVQIYFHINEKGHKLNNKYIPYSYVLFHTLKINSLIL